MKNDRIPTALKTFGLQPESLALSSLGWLGSLKTTECICPSLMSYQLFNIPRILDDSFLTTPVLPASMDFDLATDRKGNQNSTYYFDGNSYITVETDDSVLNVNAQGFTLSFWVKPDEGQSISSAPVISYGYGRSGGYNIAYWEQYGMFRTDFYDYSWTGNNVAVDEWDDYVWYMYTITYDGTAVF